MKDCHLVGIGGIGMSGLARLLLQKKIGVSGSDLAVNPLILELEEAGAKIYREHSAAHIQPGCTVVYNSQVKADNPEYAAAVKLNCPILHRSDLLQYLMKDFQALAVTGTHGKTSTTGMLVSLLLEAGLDPSYATGGVLLQTGTNAALGKGNYFAAEADESDGSFLKYTPFGAIVTNIDHDHMDFYQTEERLLASFQTFISKVQSEKHLLWCGDSPLLAGLAPAGVSYGFGEANRLRASGYAQKGWSLSFDVHFQGKQYREVVVPVIGKHQALNALAVFGMGLLLDIPEAKIRQALLAYQGTARRCEAKGEEKNILVIDDYAHHPAEIDTTLAAIRQAAQGRRLWAVFQPHRFSRTRDCLGQFGEALKNADKIVLTDIYAAGEAAIPGLDSQKVLEDIRRIFPAKDATLVARNKLLPFLTEHVRPHDVVVTVGAGDITHFGKELIDQLKGGVSRLKVGLVFGGRSAEHEVSILSARNVAAALNRELYEIHYFAITKEGKWMCGPSARDVLDKHAAAVPEITADIALSAEACIALQACDIIFPILHGPYGEDGRIQGLFESLGIAYAGSAPLAAAMSMDKAITKKLALFHGIPTVRFVDFDWHAWKAAKTLFLQQIAAQLTFPVFVKPTHLGSTIGVQRVDAAAGLEAAIENAFRYDTHVLVENGIEGREIEFAILGDQECHVFPPGEIPMLGQTYGYEEKYGAAAIQPIPKAELPPEIAEKGMAMVRRMYQILGCQGWARIDCFLDTQNQLWLNEVNPIPGCTKNSLYPLACRENGLSLSKLLEQLIGLGLSRNRQHIKATL